MVEYDLKYVDSVSRQEMSDSLGKSYLIDATLSYRCASNAVVGPNGLTQNGGGKPLYDR